MKLQTKILVPILALIVFAVGASSFFSYRQTADALEKALAGNMDGQAKSLATATKDLMETIQRDAARTAVRPDVIAFFDRPGDKEHIAAISAILKNECDSYPDILRISILDDKGTTAASSEPSTIGSNFASRSYFKNAITGGTFLASPFLSAITGRGWWWLPLRSGTRAQLRAC